MEEVQSKTNEVLSEFRESHTETQREFLANVYAESGVIPTGEEFGITEAQAATVEVGFVRTLTTDVLSQYGLSYDQWNEHLDEADLPAFRKIVMSGDFSRIHEHARLCAQMRRELGL